MKMKMETIKAEDVGGSKLINVPSTACMSGCIEGYVPEKKYQKRQNQLNKQINKLNEKITNLNLEVEKLKEKQWKYKVGDLVIANNLKVLRIVERIDERGYLYKVIDNISCNLPLKEFIESYCNRSIPKSDYDYPVAPEDILQEYRGDFDYIELLRKNNIDLKEKIKKLNKYL